MFDAQLEETTVRGMPRLHEHIGFVGDSGLGVSKLKQPFGMLMIIGASGSGKTSLVNTGYPSKVLNPQSSM